MYVIPINNTEHPIVNIQLNIAFWVSFNDIIYVL